MAGLWEVSHPAVTDLLTALSDHHPEPAVARAARKAAFKARSAGGRPGQPEFIDSSVAAACCHWVKGKAV